MQTVHRSAKCFQQFLSPVCFS